MASGLRWLTRKTARTYGDNAEERALTRESVPAAMLQSTPGGPAVTPQSALAIADAYACVRALSDAAASLPLVAYRRTQAGRTRVDSGPGELLRQPAPAVTQAALVGQLVAHLTLYGNAYVGKFRDAGGQMAQLALLHPERVRPEIKNGRPLYTVTGPRGERSVHGPDDVIHVRAAASVDGLTGLSPVRQCRAALGLSSALTTHATKFFENDARPGGVLTLSGASGTDARILSGEWKDSLAGAENAHKVAVMTGDAAFTPIGLPADDAQLLEQRKLSSTEIARVFRVPPYMIGADAGSSMTYANVEQESLHFVTYSLRPWLVLIEQALSADEDLCPGALYVEFLLDALLRADSKTRAEVYALALDPVTGWLSREEVRRLENLDPEQSAPRGPAPAPATQTPKEQLNGSPART